MADYVAKKALRIGFTKARNEGDHVTQEEVEKYGWQDDVEPASKAERKTADAKKDEGQK